MASASAPVIADAYIDSAGGAYGTDPEVTVSSMVPLAYSMVNFDPSGIIDFGFLKSARLTLTTTADVVTAGEIEVKRVGKGFFWDDGNLPFDILSSFYVEDGFRIDNYVDTPSASYTWDVTALVWRMIEEAAFNGFVLLPELVNGVSASFSTRESSVDKLPLLQIDYYID